MVNKEIERKFLVNRVPKGYNRYACDWIVQGYIVVSDNGLEVRIRKRNKSPWLTVKSAGDLKRGEWEIRLSQKQLKILWPLTKGHRIEKMRYKIRLDKKFANLDVYRGKLKGLKIVEVEFESIKEADSFTPPSWFGKEVTYDKRYKNKNLAVKGKPK